MRPTAEQMARWRFFRKFRQSGYPLTRDSGKFLGGRHIAFRWPADRRPNGQLPQASRGLKGVGNLLFEVGGLDPYLCAVIADFFENLEI